MPAAQERPTGFVTTDTQPALTELLNGTDPSLTLEEANAPEYEQTWRLNGSEWKGFLSEEGYLDREIYLMSADIAKDGAATAWILTDKSLPPNSDGSRPVLASCETNRKNAYVAKGGQLEKITSHGVGSVHCRYEYRGKGYGVRMIQELGKKLDTFQQLKSNRGRFSVLYSDIGPKFYAKNGWDAFPSTHISLKPIDNAGEYHQRKAAITPQREIQDLKLEDLVRLEPTIVSSLEDKLQALSLANPDKTFVAFKPELSQFQWHFMREDFLAENLGREIPSVKGAIDTKTGIALIWTRVYGADSSEWHLNVLYTHIPNDVSDENEGKAAIASLLLRAQWEAQIWNMTAGADIWDPNEIVVKAAQDIAYGHDVQVINRDQEHICSLKWNGPSKENVVWIANERYPWC